MIGSDIYIFKFIWRFLLFLSLACPAGWATNGIYCYYIDVTRTQNRNVARQKCQSMGADLPTIKSSGERDFIFDLMQKKQGLSKEGVWLGLDRSGSSFRWIDGTHVSYQNWGHGEPNNYGGHENCAQMYKGGVIAGKWNDIVCYNYAGYPSILCQKPVI